MDAAYATMNGMSTTAQPPAPDLSDVQSGLEDVVAFATTIAEPDKAGGALRYRGVDIEDLVGRVSYGNVWGLLVDGRFAPGLPPAEPFPVPVHSGDIRVDVQSALAMLAPAWGFRQLLDIDDTQTRKDLARATVSSVSSSGLSPQIGASMATADCTSTRMSPECTGTGNGSAGGSPGPKRPSTRSAQTLPNVTCPARSSMSTPR